MRDARLVGQNVNCQSRVDPALIIDAGLHLKPSGRLCLMASEQGEESDETLYGASSTQPHEGDALHCRTRGRGRGFAR